MGKDPAVLFYTSDFLTGTLLMSNEQVGKYIRLLCLQHQKGGLSEKDMLQICQSYDEDIFSKFEKSGDTFFNQRMMEETVKRKNYSVSRSKNRTNTNKKNICKTHEKDMSIISKSYEQHMENENENENIIDNNINNKSVEKNKMHLFSKSDFYDFEKFEAAFIGSDYEYCDLKIYHEKIKNWSASGGKKKIDWIATARNFMLGDKSNGKLILKNGTMQGEKKISKYQELMNQTEQMKELNKKLYGE